jgi:hypothetical protein
VLLDEKRVLADQKGLHELVNCDRRTKPLTSCPMARARAISDNALVRRDLENVYEGLRFLTLRRPAWPKDLGIGILDIGAAYITDFHFLFHLLAMLPWPGH